MDNDTSFSLVFPDSDRRFVWRDTALHLVQSVKHSVNEMGVVLQPGRTGAHIFLILTEIRRVESHHTVAEDNLGTIVVPG